MKYEVGKFYQCKGWYVIIFTKKVGARYAEKNSSLVWAYPAHTTFTKKEIESHWKNHFERFLGKWKCDVKLSNLDDLFYVVENDDNLFVKVISGEQVGWIITKSFLKYSLVTNETEKDK